MLHALSLFKSRLVLVIIVRRWIWLATGSNMHMVHKYCMLRPSKQFLVTCFLRPDRIEQIDLGGIGFERHDRLRGIQYTDFRHSLRRRRRPSHGLPIYIYIYIYIY